MQNNVTQTKLRKAMFKKYATYAVLMFLVVAFVFGAVVLNTRATSAKAYVGNSTRLPDAVQGYNVITPTSCESATTHDYSVSMDDISVDRYYYNFPAGYDYSDLHIVFVNSNNETFAYKYDRKSYGAAQGHTKYFVPVTTACDWGAELLTDSTSETISLTANTENGSSSATVIILEVKQSVYNEHRGNISVCLATAVKTVALPEEPTAPEGQHFVGWYYDAAFTNAYEEGDVITENTDLYAKFEVNAYTITYMVDGVQYSTSQLNHGAAIQNVVPTGVTTGKQFSGWFTDANCTTAYNFNTGNVITGDITLYSKIETIMLTVTFYVDSEVYTTLEVAYGSTLISVANGEGANAAKACAILEVFNFADDSTITADTEITEDTEVTGSLDEKTVNWINTGIWFQANWPWLVAVIAVVIVIIAGSVILAKKRR